VAIKFKYSYHTLWLDSEILIRYFKKRKKAAIFTVKLMLRFSHVMKRFLLLFLLLAGRYEDQYIIRFYKDKLHSMPCQNQVNFPIVQL